MGDYDGAPGQEHWVIFVSEQLITTAGGTLIDRSVPAPSPRNSGNWNRSLRIPRQSNHSGSTLDLHPARILARAIWLVGELRDDATNGRAAPHFYVYQGLNRHLKSYGWSLELPVHQVRERRGWK
jgi:hypothetical protein